MWRVSAAQLAAAVALDLLLGDPRGWPHPARITGAYAKFLESVHELYKWKRGVLDGAYFWLIVAGGVVFAYGIFCRLCTTLHPAAAWIFTVFVTYQCVAITDLRRHVLRVFSPLQNGDLAAARAALSQIVGRDTAELGEREISRATIETVAESMCDGIVAPLFWAAVAGWPGALIYRVANTLDSMVGHRDAQYERFGKASARIDDALNFLPARLTALCIICCTSLRSLKTIRREAAAHASPNAGWPEAAMAHALGIRLGGENSYGGIVSPGPVFHADGRAPVPDDIPRALRVLKIATAIAVALLLTGLLFFTAFSET